VQLYNAANPAGGIATVIIGGYVYRGSTFPQLQGKYIFGTFSQHGAPDGKVYVAGDATTGLRGYSELVIHNYESSVGQYIKGFGQGSYGEIYLLTSGIAGRTGSTGKVYRLIGVH